MLPTADVVNSVIFEATGDLARRIVLSAFYRLASEGLLPRQWLLVGNGRSEMAHKYAASGLPMPHATHPVAIPKGAQNRRIWPFVTTRK